MYGVILKRIVDISLKNCLYYFHPHMFHKAGVTALLHYATNIIRVCSEILFSTALCRIEASHLIFDANRLNGFCMVRSFTGRCFRTNHNLFLFAFFYSFVLHFFPREVREA